MDQFSSTDGNGSSIGERLRSARIAAELSTRALADRLPKRFKVSHATLANYERGDTVPGMDFISAVASELDRPLEWFLRSGLPLRNVRYRNRKSLVSRTACIRFEFESQTWLDAYAYVESCLKEPLSKSRRFDLDDYKGTHPEKQARAVRAALKLKPEDPLYSVPKAMEAFGIRVIEVSSSEAIDGLAALYGNEYVTVLARGLDGGRSRLSAAHEFGHFIAGDVDAEAPHPDADARAFSFGFHLLMPMTVLKRAIERRSIVHLVEIKNMYGVSLAAMIYRAEQAGYLSKRDARGIWIEFAKRGWRKQEPGQIAPDRALRFEVLFERALALNKLSLGDVSRKSGISITALRRRLAASIGFLDEPVEMVESFPGHGLRLVRE